MTLIKIGWKLSNKFFNCAGILQLVYLYDSLIDYKNIYLDWRWIDFQEDGYLNLGLKYGLE